MASSASKAPLFRSVAIRGYAAQAASKPARGSGDVQTTTLPNKLVVASAKPGLPLSRVSILVRAGSRNETYENLGAAHVLRVAAGLTTKGSTTFAITRNIQQIGGSLSVTGDRETLAYTLEVTPNHLDTGLKFLQDVATGQEFKPWELEEIVPRLREDLARVSLQTRAVDLLHRAAYRSALGNSLFCPKHQIGRISPETLQHYVASNYTTNRTAVVGVGVEHNTLVGYAQNLPLDSGAGKDNVSSFVGGQEARLDRGGRLAHVAIATQGAGWATPKEALALHVLQYAAGVGSWTKRGNVNGVIGKAVTAALGDKPLGFGAFNASYSDDGLFGFVLSTEARDAGKAIEAALKTLRTGSLSSEDIARGKTQFKNDFLYYVENGENFATDMGAQAALCGAVLSPDAIVAEIDAVSASDVNAAAKKVASAKLALGAVGNLATVPHVHEL
ncbi:cytochrome b-c1 complex subunit 2, mitochondrial [Phlebotomus argentipes]|uniref:cytochrome b-c1 complex subunit 2, mitochondrial n=1 Tax=Phlebotomus argentipes TaxID=94469 RepID=UPI0028933655|nr:cytochrome b-c1 complex subunit 2, mitochondrial [Phlebotomus argentipes]